MVSAAPKKLYRFKKLARKAIVSLAALACLHGCNVGSSEPLILSLTPGKDIVVVDGERVTFTVVTVDNAAGYKYSWGKFPENTPGISLEGLNTAVVTIPFSLADDKSRVYVDVTAADGSGDSAATQSIKVIPKQ